MYKVGLALLQPARPIIVISSTRASTKVILFILISINLGFAYYSGIPQTFDGIHELQRNPTGEKEHEQGQDGISDISSYVGDPSIHYWTNNGRQPACQGIKSEELSLTVVGREYRQHGSAV